VRNCKDCGVRIDPGNRTGKCRKCLYLINQVPADRRNDYSLMQGRVGAKAAFEWIMSGKAVTPSQVTPRVTATAKDVIRTVATELQLCPDMIAGAKRFMPLVRARAAVSVILHRNGMGYSQIGRRLNRDHSSIMHLVEQFPAYAARDARLERIVRNYGKAA